MPELPEVETIRRQLQKELVGETVTEVWFDRPKMLRPSAAIFKNAAEGKIITGLSRRAKLLILELNHGKNGFIATHLKLSGRIFLRNSKNPADDYVHVVLKFNSGKELRFAEARLFGYMQYLADKKELDEALGGYGPEPLDDLDEETFYSILQKTARPIKITLMDQKRISGVGNIYANDALYLSHLSPLFPSNKLNREQSNRLLKAIEQVLREGLRFGGASDQWYRQIHGEKGRYQEHFKVYGKQGQKCPECGGEIKRIEVGGRGTFFCPTCQKLP